MNMVVVVVMPTVTTTVAATTTMMMATMTVNDYGYDGDDGNDDDDVDDYEEIPFHPKPINTKLYGHCSPISRSFKRG